MGYENENADAIVVDLETIAREGIDALLDEPTAPANYKDAEKIAAKKKERLEAQIANAALDPELNRIIAAGIWTSGTGTHVIIAQTPKDEWMLVRTVAELIQMPGGGLRRVITFNGLTFDLPTLLNAAERHELPFPALNLSRYNNPNTDLIDVATFSGRQGKRTLDFYCRVRGITTDDPAITDEMKAVAGSDIARLAAEGRWDLIEGHCKYDVIRTVAFAKRKRVLR